MWRRGKFLSIRRCFRLRCRVNRSSRTHYLLSWEFENDWICRNNALWRTHLALNVPRLTGLCSFLAQVLFSSCLFIVSGSLKQCRRPPHSMPISSSWWAGSQTQPAPTRKSFFVSSSRLSLTRHSPPSQCGLLHWNDTERVREHLGMITKSGT